MKLHAITLLPDNYIWLLSDNRNNCIIVDPGSAKLVIDYVNNNQLVPKAILLTHHHNDHIAGALALQEHYSDVVIYAPEEITRLKQFSAIAEHQIREIADTDKLIINDFSFTVIGLPGHTLGHVAFYQAPYLFCGDTLFSAGCGRIFEGTAAQLFTSLMKLAALPEQTLICCGHEYTMANLKFAHHLLPDDPVINQYLAQVENLRAENKPTLPSTLKLEKQINLFLRTNDSKIQQALGYTNGSNDDIEVFAKLRKLKDRF